MCCTTQSSSPPNGLASSETPTASNRGCSPFCATRCIDARKLFAERSRPTRARAFGPPGARWARPGRRPWRECQPELHAGAQKAKARQEKSLGAYVIAKAGRNECGDLDRLLGKWDGDFTVLIRKRVARHVDECDTCSTRRRKVAPLAMCAGVHRPRPRCATEFLTLPRCSLPLVRRRTSSPQPIDSHRSSRASAKWLHGSHRPLRRH